MTDIVERLREENESDPQHIRESRIVLAGLLEKAAAEIERLRQALHIIANDYVELSHDKVKWQRDDHIKTARKALEESYETD